MATVWMFHYVRPVEEASFPHLKGFSLADFKVFLDTLSDQGTILDPETYLNLVMREEALPADDCFLLTFDDGLYDHYRWVFPELKKRGLTALFFVASGSLEKMELLRVHKIHAMYGARGYSWLRETFLRLAHADGKAPETIYADPRARSAYPYDDELTAGFKYALNYVLPQDEVEAILNQILAESFDEESLARQFYLSPAQIQEMSASGMLFGYHGHTHTPFSRLTSQVLEREMAASERLLGALLPARPVCLSYPYGDESAVTDENVMVLKRRGIRAAFTAESKPLRQGAYHLPRVDCADWRA